MNATNGAPDHPPTPVDAHRGAEAGKAEVAPKHPRTEFCFHCAPDEMLLRGLALHDEGKPWDGPTVHMQVPESFCPHMADDSTERDGRVSE